MPGEGAESSCEKPALFPLHSCPQEQGRNAVLDPQAQPGGRHLLGPSLPSCCQLHEEVLSAPAALLHHSPLPGTSCRDHNTASLGCHPPCQAPDSTAPTSAPIQSWSRAKRQGGRADILLHPTTLHPHLQMGSLRPHATQRPGSAVAGGTGVLLCQGQCVLWM